MTTEEMLVSAVETARILRDELTASRAECERLRALAEHISLNPYGLTQDQWATEARAALRGDV